MKQLILLLTCFLCVAYLFSACKEETLPNASDPTSSTSTFPTIPTETTATLPTDLPNTTAPTIPLPTNPTNAMEYLPGFIILQDQESDDYDFERKYRITYYRIWSEFFDLLTEDQLSDFYIWIDESIRQSNYGEFQNEMLLVSMVKRYNIPREEFDKAVDAYVTDNVRSNTDMTLEEFEIPNADVIYTFDNEIINYYYRYE